MSDPFIKNMKLVLLARAILYLSVQPYSSDTYTIKTLPIYSKGFTFSLSNQLTDPNYYKPNNLGIIMDISGI